MKDTMTISLEKDLKKEFTDFAKSLGTNPTNLLNMMMKNTIIKREVVFVSPSVLDLEVESFSSEELRSLNNNKSIQKNIEKSEILLSDI